MEPNVIIPLEEYERLKEEASKILINEIKVTGEPFLEGVKITFPSETSSEVYRKVIHTFKDMHGIIDHPLGYSPELFVLSYDVRRQLAAYQDVLDAKEKRLNEEIARFEETKKRSMKRARICTTSLCILWTILYLLFFLWKS